MRKMNYDVIYRGRRVSGNGDAKFLPSRNVLNYFFEFCLFDQLVFPAACFDAKTARHSAEVRKPFARASIARIKSTVHGKRFRAGRDSPSSERTSSHRGLTSLEGNVDEYRLQYTFRIDGDDVSTNSHDTREQIRNVERDTRSASFSLLIFDHGAE